MLLNVCRSLYDENLSSVTGNIILSHLKKVTTEQNRPAVFKRAGELFNRITRGRYELILEEKGEPSFRAFDTKNREGLSLGDIVYRNPYPATAIGKARFY